MKVVFIFWAFLQAIRYISQLIWEDDATILNAIKCKITILSNVKTSSSNRIIRELLTFNFQESEVSIGKVLYYKKTCAAFDTHKLY